MKPVSKIIFIVGPTAIGKTRLSIKLARRIGGEIISCDSMQVYRGMAILSQAPGAVDKKKIKHHLVGILDPKEEYNVALFRESAAKIIRSIIDRKKIPILVGGSGLYVKALIDGLFPSPRADLAFRNKMERDVSSYGNRKLYVKLVKIDPDTAMSIHPNDARRIIRALEVYNATGRTMTELKQNTHGLKEIYDIRIFGLIKSREDIYSNIDSRVDKMFETGVVDEVRRLRNKRLSKTAKAVLGFKEICACLDGEYDIDQAKARIKINTRHFAKRQLIWLRPDKRISWFDASKLSDGAIIEKVIKHLG